MQRNSRPLPPNRERVGKQQQRHGAAVGCRTGLLARPGFQKPSACRQISDGPGDPSYNKAPHQRRVRAGFTMLELLLVLGVVAVILAVAWPNVLRLTNQQKLMDSAEKVRSLAASARIHAIDSGLVYQFRYEPGGRHFVVIPFEKEFESVSPSARGTGTATGLGRFSKASGTLPEGVTFAAPKLVGTGTSVSVTGTGQKLPGDAFSGLADATKLAAASWSGPLLFQSDGSGNDASVDLIDSRRQRITLMIRQVTGAVSLSRLHHEERP